MTPRPLTLSDLWLPGSALGGAILRGWTGPVWALRGTEWIGATWAPHMSEAPVIYGGKVDSFAGVADVRLDCDIPEVRDRIARVLHAGERCDLFRGSGLLYPKHPHESCLTCGGTGYVRPPADLLPIHAAELRGEITPGEAAGLVWCSVVRREAGLGVVQAILGETERLAHITYRKYIAGERVGRVRDGDAAQLALGVALREPGGILLLPLPDGVVGRLETRA